MKSVFGMLTLTAALAARAAADPATIVSFSWSTTGTTDASASATCLTPPENHCGVTGGCSSPTPTFVEGGASMAYTLRSVSAASSCTFGCGCCISGGGSGAGQARSDYTINAPSSSAGLTQWGFADRLYVGASATGQAVPQCVTGSGSGLGFATYEFDLVFDTSGTTRLILTREHYVNVLQIGSAETTYTLTRVSPTPETLFTQTLSSTGGAQDGQGQTLTVLPAGRYRVHIQGQGRALAEIASGAGGIGGSIEVWFGCSLRVEPYECPVQTGGTGGGTLCVGQNANFSVAADGRQVFYQWRRNGVPLVGGLTPAGSPTIGERTPFLTIIGLRAGDAGSYDCVLTNDCGGVPTGAAELRICAADFNCDGFLDFFDADAFVECFEGRQCPYGRTADFNGDDFVDFFDADAFASAFELGC